MGVHQTLQEPLAVKLLWGLTVYHPVFTRLLSTQVGWRPPACLHWELHPPPPAPWTAGPTSGLAGLPASPGLRPSVPAALRPSEAVSRAYLLPSSGPLGSSAELRAFLARLCALWGVGDVPQSVPLQRGHHFEERRGRCPLGRGLPWLRESFSECPSPPKAGVTLDPERLLLGGA